MGSSHLRLPYCVLWKCAWRRSWGKRLAAASQTAFRSTCSPWGPPANTAGPAGPEHPPPSQHTLARGGPVAVWEVAYFHTEPRAEPGSRHGAILFTRSCRSLEAAAHQGRGDGCLWRNSVRDRTFHAVCRDKILPLQTPRGKPDLLRPSATRTRSSCRMNLELGPTVGASPVCKPGVKRGRGREM